MMQHSIVEYLSGNDGHRCGYCGASDSNYSNGMWAHTMTCQDYKDLIDRGWRRSGKYVYKPSMDRMCCPLYTIRCHAPSFKISKSQKKVLKRATRFFTTGDRGGSGGGGARDGVQAVGFDAKETEDQPQGDQEHPTPSRAPQMATRELTGFSNQLQEAGVTGSEVNSEARARTTPQTDSKGVASREECGASQKRGAEGSAKMQSKSPKPGLGPDPNKPRCMKAKQRRLEKKQEKTGKRLESSGQEGAKVNHADKHSRSKVNNEAKPLEEFIVDAVPGQEPKHRLEVRLIRTSPPSAEYKATEKESHRVYEKYQTFVHNDPPDECTLPEYKRFLVDSPLIEDNAVNGPECGYGSFHQHYLLDGKIIAVGVIDILPTCISSVYFYYDPDYRFLTLGTFSALRELAFTRLLNVTAPSLQYYYMGFYVHSCRKMRYKGQYYPSYLLCPETYTFHPIEECTPKLDVNRYSRFSPPDAADTPIELDQVRILCHNRAMTYEVYRQVRPHVCDRGEVEQYARMAGKTCSERMLLYRN